MATFRAPICPLLKRTLELLRNRPRALTLQQIEDQTGLPIGWLTYLATPSNDPFEPGVNRIVILYQYLSHRNIEL